MLYVMYLDTKISKKSGFTEGLSEVLVISEVNELLLVIEKIMCSARLGNVRHEG